MSELGVLVVGPGWVAGEHINAFIKDSRTEIRSIVGRSSKSQDRAVEYLKNYKHKWSYCSYKDYGKELRREDIDLVSICSINKDHYTHALEAIDAGKHVLGGIHLTGVLASSGHGVSSRWQALAAVGWRVPGLVPDRRGLPGLPGMAAVARRLRLSELWPCMKVVGAWTMIEPCVRRVRGAVR